MSQTVRLRNIGAQALEVGPYGRVVEPDCLYETPGQVSTDPAEVAQCLGLADGTAPTMPHDAWLIIHDGDVRSWPKSIWAVESAPSKAKAKE